VPRKTTKFCNRCGLTKPIAEFGRHQGHGDGYESWCKPCMRDADRAKRALQKPKVYSPPKLRGQLEKRHQEMLRATPEAFEAFFNEFSGLKLPAHAKSWVASALANKRLLLNVPPRHAKSTIMAQWFPIWLIARDRDIQIIIVSQTTQGPAAQAIRKISYELESNTKLNHAFGRFRPDRNDGVWRALDIQVEGKDFGKRPGLTIQIRGSMQAILGMEEIGRAHV